MTFVAGLLAVVAVTACSDSGGGDLGGGPDPAARSARRAEPSGNGQTGTAGQDLDTPLRIVVLQGGTPEAGAVVTWNSAANGASLTPTVDTTGPDGISTSVWHLGSAPGTQTSQAAVAGGADGSPVPFTATANAPGGGPPGAVEIRLLSSGGNRFDPANVTIAVGTTVTWTWVGGFHDVTATGNPGFPSSGAPGAPPRSLSHTFTARGTYLYFCSVHGSPGFPSSGAPGAPPRSLSHTFTAPGTYLYFCSVHGSPTAGMRGTIVVQ